MPHPRKYPSDSELRRLYIDEQRSAQNIADMFHGDISGLYKLFRRAGITPRKGRIETCIESGCSEPVYKVRHSNNGSTYGRRCKEHRRAHYAKLNRDEKRKARAITPDRYKPWQRKDDDLTDYEKETLWIIKGKKLLKQTNKHLRNQQRREV